MRRGAISPKRLAALEAKKPRMVSTWVDFMIWLDEHERNEGELKEEFARICRACRNGFSQKPWVCMYVEVNDNFGPTTPEGAIWDQRAEKELQILHDAKVGFILRMVG